MMDFTTVYHAFTQSLDGTDSYVVLRRDLDSLIGSDPDNAVSYYVLRGLADSYVTLYADQAVSPDFAHQAKTEMIRLLDIVKPALADKTASVAVRYQAINALVTSYSSGKKRF
ncbi:MULTISPECIES: hypothetical protein [unclassified Symbiopectobacterium]|uniref:hypothetical protein n=1 Tax=unclassified Symbiopectobacterium TaxID=2794573 RepID=UPI00222749B2|nr:MULTISPECIES: hypothetical protein [unclassified Symbiopectobacterium]MCW2475722.1 hypothetical protein [Candidatus Symbiopectobacterium sp. NZEC151]MCW2486095.1 hypothetical protein [Candidatus Symbiopectobacterium sp. NZEC127]